MKLAENEGRGVVLDQHGREAHISPESLVRRFREELASLKLDVARSNSVQSQDVERLNGAPWGLNGLVGGVFGQADWQPSALAQPFTLGNANAYSPITLQRQILNYSYMSQGLVQTVVCQPVDDAFRGGFKLKSLELDADDLKQLERAMKRNQTGSVIKRAARSIGATVNYNSGINLARSDVNAIKTSIYWARLFGGGGLIVNTDQSYKAPLNIDAIRPDSPLVFIPANRWELVLGNLMVFDYQNPAPYDYYGLSVNSTRVMPIIWNEAPDYIRRQLQGWGMSEIERCIRSINAFLKFENLIFELLDEAKIDVWKMLNYNTLLASPQGTQRVREAVLQTNQLKNFSNAIVMDTKDEYEQKQLSGIFSGLSDAWEQLRLNLCSDLKIPRNKLFGEGQSGFGSGEDSLENYNSTVEGVREAANPLVLDVAGLRCKQLHGFIPEDLEVEWPSLRVLKQTDMETINTAKQKRVTDLFSLGLIDGKEASELLKKDGLLTIDTAVLLGKKDAIAPAAQQEMEQLEFASEAAKRAGKNRVMGGGKQAKAA